MSVQRYTVGFLFQRNHVGNDRVLLVRKTRPEWQDGLLNGIGGKLESNEQPADCMAREFTEETGIAGLAWTYFMVECGPSYACFYYRARAPIGELLAVPEANDVGERLHWCEPGVTGVVGNLRWLIPMAQDWRRVVCKAVTTDNIAERPVW